MATDDGLVRTGRVREGFDTTTIALGMGLQNMQDRLAARGGELRIASRPSVGTEIRGSLPL
jgi:signal transduction histidine kinase